MNVNGNRTKGMHRLVRGDRVTIKKFAESVALALGLRIEPAYHSLFEQRRRVLDDAQIEVVIDVGANVGQYGSALRRTGFGGRIISFEPQPEAAHALRERVVPDGQWMVEECALGSKPEDLRLFQTYDSLSSSLLAPASHEQDRSFLAGKWGKVVSVKRLDDFGIVPAPDRGLYLKMDVQGYEMAVLSGAGETLSRAAAVECELSLRDLYEEQTLAEEVIRKLRLEGFIPICLTRGYTDPDTHQVIQMDGIFLRESLTLT